MSFEVDKNGRVVLDSREQKLLDLIMMTHSGANTEVRVGALYEMTDWGAGLTMHVLWRLIHRGLVAPMNPASRTPLEWVHVTALGRKHASDDATTMSLLGVRRC